jgi:trehalose/maltose hydrolase-like predicted phosphorylase
MGGFWPGHIDHSCTAWTAQLMWQYWRYTLDDEFMRDTLYPFMKAVMNVYAAMLEEDGDGKLFLAAESFP